MRYPTYVFLAAASLASSQVLAANTIEFKGEVLEQSCKATINGETNAVVTLDAVNVNDFAGSNVAGAKNFTIEVSGCNTAAEHDRLKVRFALKSGGAPTGNGNLPNTAADDIKADGISVRLLEGSNHIDFNNLASLENTTGAKNPHTFTAQYFAEKSDIKPGAVRAVAEYRLSYF